jgi:hypothetical protein
MASEHIKIPEGRTRVGYLIGAAPVNSVVIPFPFFQASDIAVLRAGSPLILGVHYNVIGTGGFDKGFPGGTVVFTAPVANTAITVERHVPISRTVDFPNSGPLQTAALNTELDKSVAIDQQLADDILGLDSRIDILELGDPRLGRAVLFPPEDIALNHSLPSIGDRQNRIFGFGTDGNIQMQAGLIFPPSENRNNVVFPSPAGRANRVIGFDASGANVTYQEVVAGAIVPDAANINYTAAIPTPASRSVEARLGERLSIKDFGTQVGEGIQAKDDAALLAAVNYLNSLPIGNDHFHTIYYPDGIYNHGACPVKLTASNCGFAGNSRATTIINFFGGASPWLVIGNAALATTQHVIIRDLHFNVDTSATGELFILEHTFDVQVVSVTGNGLKSFLRAGTGTGGAFNTVVFNCGGTSSNAAHNLFFCFNGGGLSVRGCDFQVPSISNPDTIVDNNVVCYAQDCNFNAIHFHDSVFAFYDIGFALNQLAAGKVVTDVFVDACQFTGFKRWIVQAMASAGVISRVVMRNCWMDCKRTDAIIFQGTGTAGNNDNNAIESCHIANAGRGAVIVSTVASLMIRIANNFITNCNQIGTATGAITMETGGGCNIIGNTGFVNSPWGIDLGGANNDHYNVIGNRLVGTSGALRFAFGFGGDGLRSNSRRCEANSYMNVAQGGLALASLVGLADGTHWENMTPFCQQVTISGGTVSSILLDGNNTGATFGTFTVEPGETLSINNTSAPNVFVRYLS